MDHLLEWEEFSLNESSKEINKSRLNTLMIALDDISSAANSINKTRKKPNYTVDDIVEFRSNYYSCLKKITKFVDEFSEETLKNALPDQYKDILSQSLKLGKNGYSDWK